MPLTLNCPKCKKPFRVRDEALGARVKCPSCAQILQVPSSISPASMVDIPMEDNTKSKTEQIGPPPIPPAPFPDSTRIQVPDRRRNTPQEEDKPEDVLASQPHPDTRKKPLASSDRTVPIPSNTSSPRNVVRSPQQQGAQSSAFGSESDLYRRWKSVKAGLRATQVAIWIALLPFLCEVGKWIYFFVEKIDPTLKEGQFGYPFWTEITVAYWFVLFVLASLLVILSRMRLGRVPAATHASGLGTGSMLMGLLSFLGFLGGVALVVLEVSGKLDEREKLYSIGLRSSLAVFILFGLLGEIWFLLYLGQVGAFTTEPRMQIRVARSLVLLVMLIAIPVIVRFFYPLFQTEVAFNPLGAFPAIGDRRDALLQNAMISWGIVAGIAFVLACLYTNLIGVLRRSVRRIVDEKAPIQVMLR
jgi:predicted Zn finger-like uncharacterized protein